MKKNSPQSTHPASLQMLSADVDKKKKGPGFAGGFLFGFLFLLLPLLVLAAGLWFDLLDLKAQAAELLQLDAARTASLDAEKAELDRRDARLHDLGLEIEDKETQLSRQQQELQSLEQSLETLQEELDERAASIARQEVELDELVSLYESMEPEKAAAILMHSDDQVLNTRIMQRMEQSRLSRILTHLSPQEAADMIQLLSDAP